MADLKNILTHFLLAGTILGIKPLGNGLINDTYKVETEGETTPDYVLQRINHNVFQNVDALQKNIELVTRHLRKKVEASEESETDRRVLHFIPTSDGKTYWYDGNDYWRVSVFISHAKTYEAVTPEHAYDAGKAFGKFQADLADLPEQLEETIPNFHNMEFRLEQLREAVAKDPVGRVSSVADLLEQLESRAEYMCQAERLYREGKLPKRVCHCDTKVNNLMFDEDGSVLSVIDLDTVMPSFIFSDYGDFLRSAANTGNEDDTDLDNVSFNMDIFRPFTKGYLESAQSFLTPVEIELLPYAVALFPYMQTVRFLTDYINGDTYYKIQYPEHNLVRSKAQFKLLCSVEEKTPEMKAYIDACLSPKKELSIKRIQLPDISLDNIPGYLDSLGIEFTEINIANWERFPYKPEAYFRMVTTRKGLLIHYHVTENTIAALADIDNGNVWEDSCVEFFSVPANDGIYYNMECNCIGTLLVGAGKNRTGRLCAPLDVLEKVERWSSLGRKSFKEKNGPVTWDLVLSIPYSTFFLHDIKTLEGQTIRANFYKCGDKLQSPHYLSWNPISLPKPNFHCPDFFGILHFEKEEE